MRTLKLIGMLAIAVAGCNPMAPGKNKIMQNVAVGPEPEPDSGMLIITSRETGRPVELRVGQEFGVALGEHPSVGETWEAVDLPPALRANGKMSSVPADVQPGGDSGITTFRFVATQAGTVTLRMVNKFRGDSMGEMTIQLVIR